ncbi:endo alpha-1,4 polygalactosaminidase [Naasia lichenicola]|uniref:Glycoside-hydrolase family GH114 TIM-barrel domain-containing protein n=1 Tax=Naasia lichenicola TaxID=2565933 RepID=A0A4S4FT87_9MICO|nr:endo alpha-1,4 polygalactosaminidase [Naasia lichenicola]THG32965.1 hypothetical protein E6C64_00920 [Naasia lichenicola]
MPRTRRLRSTGRAAGALALLLGVALGVALAGCSSAPLGAGPGSSPDSNVVLPPSGGIADYQLGGAYPPADAVTIVERDSTDAPEPGLYSICYLNGFQSQPGETAEWIADRSDLVLTSDGAPIIDENWPDEVIFDTSTAEKRESILAVIGPLIDGCRSSGFDAVEFDNLDSFSRSAGRMTAEDNFALAAAYVQRAHASGLAAAQKNSVEHSRQLHDEVGFDFAVTEECWRFDECDGYIDVYGDRVLDIEYSDDLREEFASSCASADRPATMILRDRDLVTPDDPAYVFEHC